MGLHKREAVIRAFLNTGYNSMCLDWYSMGYTNAKTCRASIAQTIAKMKAPCFCEQRKDRVFLVRPEAYSFDYTKTGASFSIRMAEKNKRVKNLLEKFIESDRWVYQLLWGRMGYMSVSSCYTSYRTAINFYGYEDKIFVAKKHEEIFLVRRPEPPTEETKLEPYWDEEIKITADSTAPDMKGV